MLRSTARVFTRKVSIKSLPHETQPTNKYNGARSKFNVKPVPTEGLIYNPPASLPSAKDTPRAFLPANDPRLSIMADKFKTYTVKELDTMPIIYATKKEYDLTLEIVEQIFTLRHDNPKEWTIAKLAAKFNVDPKKVNIVTGLSEQKQLAILLKLERQKEKWSQKKKVARDDRKKRKQMWLRNEF